MQCKIFSLNIIMCQLSLSTIFFILNFFFFTTISNHKNVKYFLSIHLSKKYLKINSYACTSVFKLPDRSSVVNVLQQSKN